MSIRADLYIMNPAEDEILFGDEITEGMWVLPEDTLFRLNLGGDEDRALRLNRFRKVTKLRRRSDMLVFVGEWVDGYQEVCRYNVSYGWLVKKTAPEEPAAEQAAS